MLKYIFQIVTTLLITFIEVKSDKTLLSVNLLFRHGDRTPIRPYPNDPHKDPSNWPVGFGQLTTRGKQMHYKLGKFLRSRYGSQGQGSYKDFLGQKYNETEIYVRSTDVDRTLMSAMSNLAGLYPPSGDQIWNKDIMWQPIPVHTRPTPEDNILSEHAECERYDILYDAMMQSPEIEEINQKYQQVYDYATKMSGNQVSTLVEADYLRDTLFIEQTYNKTLPDWTAKIYPQPLTEMQDISFKLSTWTKDLARLRAGPLIKNIVDRLKSIRSQYAAKGAFSEQRMIMYSAHDTTVAYFLNAIGAFDPPKAPPYAACVILELFHDNATKDYDIKLSYHNESDHEPYTLPLCGSEFCSLSWFDNYTAPLRPGNWQEECQITKEDPFIWIVTVTSVCLTCLIVVVLLISVAISLAKRRRNAYQTSLYEYAPVNEN